MHVLIVDDVALSTRRIELSCFPTSASDERCRSGFCGGGNGRDDGSKARFVFLDIHLIADESGFDLAEKLTHLKSALLGLCNRL